MSKPAGTATVKTEDKGGWFKWWYLLPLLGLLAFLPKLFKKKPVVVEPVKVAPKVVATPPPPVKKVVAPPPPPVKKVVAPPPPPVKKVVAPPPPPAPRPVTPPPAPRVVEVPKVVPVVPVVEAPKATIREVHHEEVAPVIHYETHTPTETTIKVTYENNAMGDHQESRADKSDLTPDHLQE